MHGNGRNHYITSTGWDLGRGVNHESEHWDIGVSFFLSYTVASTTRSTALLPFYNPIGGPVVSNGSNGDGFLFTTIPALLFM